MEISRDFYLEKLIKRKNNGLIKVVTGIRRCGKSFLLNNLFYHHLLESGVDTDHIIRFAFDSADDLHLIGESLIQMNKEKRGADPEKFTAYIRAKVAKHQLGVIAGYSRLSHRGRSICIQSGEQHTRFDLRRGNR